MNGEEVLDVEADADDIDEVAGIDSEGWAPAAQAIGGFDYYFTDRFSAFAKYKALWLFSDSDELGSYLQHLVGGGFRFHS